MIVWIQTIFIFSMLILMIVYYFNSNDLVLESGNVQFSSGNCYKERLMKRGFVIISIVLVLLLFLKHDYVGVDTQNYRYTYNNFLSGNYQIFTDRDYGFYYLNIFFAKQNIPFRIMILFFAIFYIFTFANLIKRFSLSPLFSYFLFISLGFFYFFNTLRQALAVSLCIWAFIFIIDKKYIKSILFAILAVSMHKSALVFLLFYPCRKLKWNNNVIRFVPFIIFFLNLLFNKQITNFILNYVNESITKSTTGGYISIAISLLLSLVAILYKDQFSDAGNNDEFITFIILTCCLYPLGKYSPYFFRILNYFKVYYIIFIPNFIKSIKDKNLSNIICIFFILFGLISFFDIRSGLRTFPYVFFFQEYPYHLVENLNLLPYGGW